MGNIGQCKWPTCDCEDYEGHPCKINNPDAYVEARLRKAGAKNDETIRKAVELAQRAREYRRKQKDLISKITDPVMRQGVIDSLKD